MAKLKLYRPMDCKLNYPWGNAYTINNIWHKSVVGQKFGENSVCIGADDKLVFTDNNVCPTGYRSVYASFGMKGHNGIDIPCAFRSPVYSPIDGTVIDVSLDRTKGIGCYVRSTKEFDYSTGLAYYKVGLWHFDEIVVENGQRIDTGQLLGYADTTGYSTGNHLHFELKPVRKDAKGYYYNIEQENGYYGCLDPITLIIEEDAVNYQSKLLSISEQLKKILDKIKWLFTQAKSK